MSENNTAAPAGNVRISEEVIAIVAGIAANSVNGVAGMSSSFASGIAELLGKKNLAKGVKAEISETTVKIGMSIVVEHGCRIPEVAWEVQEKVKREVESMTGLEVPEVSIFVDGLAMPKAAEAAEAEGAE